MSAKNITWKYRPSTQFWILGSLILFLLLIACFFYYFECLRWSSISNSSSSNLLYYDSQYSKKPRVVSSHRVVITLTTTPDRIHYLRPTIVSLLDSSVRVDEIRINIPYVSCKGKPYSVPSWLTNLQSVTVVRIEEDLGPASKLIPTSLDEDASTLLIVIDDDMIYGSEMIANLVAEYYRHDQKAVITVLGSFPKHYFQRTSRVRLIADYFKGSHKVEIVRGISGFIIANHMIPKEFLHFESGPPAAKWVDDDWLSGWLQIEKIPIYSLGSRLKSQFIYNLRSLGTESLIHGVNALNYNSQVVWSWFAENYPEEININ